MTADQNVSAMIAEVAALKESFQRLAEATGLDPDELNAMIRRSLKENDSLKQ